MCGWPWRCREPIRKGESGDAPPVAIRRGSTSRSRMAPHLLQPGQTLGIIGGGQLGRMLAREARRSGYRVVVFTDEYPPSPAGQLADREINAPYFDPEAAAQFIREADVVTMEFENIPGAFL